MADFITRFPLYRFDELVPLLMRCFPEFWEPRLKRGMRSFPYDLKLFTAELDFQRIGCIGLHDYSIEFEDTVIQGHGVSDVAVDPDHRGRGHALQLQEFVLKYCRRNAANGFMPLYTEKPGVYTRFGWEIYESDRSSEIQTEKFPKKKTFRLDPGKLRLSFLRNGGMAKNPEEETAEQIQAIYRNGRTFPGKCLRSGKLWWELFADPEYEWQLEGDTYYLYRGEVLYEAYSSDPMHSVSGFTPRHGGHDSNKVMVNFAKICNPKEEELSAAVNEKTLIFPAADVF